MAATEKLAATAILVVLLTAVALVPTSASTLTAFSGKGCAGKTKDVNGCGCHSIKGDQGGYHFVFTARQKATLYTSEYCIGHSYDLKKETRRCEKNSFNSIYMHC